MFFNLAQTLRSLTTSPISTARSIRRTAWTPRRASVRQGAASNSPLKGVDHFLTFFLERRS